MFKSALLIFSACIALSACETCNSPQISSKFFSTDDSTYLTNIAFIGEIEVKCSPNSPVKNLYSEVNGVVSPLSVVGPNTFQVSWTEDPKKSSSGQRLVRVYLEDDVPNLRKVIKNGGDISSVPSLGEVTFHHPGSYSGPYFQGEFLAFIVSLVAAYFAVMSKMQITS